MADIIAYIVTVSLLAVLFMCGWVVGYYAKERPSAEDK